MITIREFHNIYTLSCAGCEARPNKLVEIVSKELVSVELCNACLRKVQRYIEKRNRQKEQQL